MITIENDFINLEMNLSISNKDLKNILGKISSELKINSYEEKYIVNTNNNVELFTIAEVANKLKVNKNTVYNLIKTKHLSALKLGSLKVTSTELERFLKYAEGKDFSNLNNVKHLEFDT